MLGKNETDPVKRARRIAQAESCPYFGLWSLFPTKIKAFAPIWVNWLIWDSLGSRTSV